MYEIYTIQRLQKAIVASTLHIEDFGSYFIGEEMQEAAKKYEYKALRTFNEPKDLAECGIDVDLPENTFPIKIMVVGPERERKGIEKRIKKKKRKSRKSSQPFLFTV
ncbi:hypothetical protein PYW07_011456 [Mythimna separata]|uniref:Uncharacterized protein n=1 Tax=Mythimna separata TaxID=271217 RepID=A0AAD7Y9W3_MYTSE|nr:hypothetical protein PYW07_011456 [Mythimna separata]